MGLLLSDNFQRVAGNLGSNWAQLSGGFTVNNGAFSTQSTVFNAASFSASPFALNQQIMFTVGSNGNANLQGVIFRATNNAGTFSYYIVEAVPSGITVYKITGATASSNGTVLQLGSPYMNTINSGDIITVCCFGPNIVVFHGLPTSAPAVLNMTDSSLSGGLCGLFQNGNGDSIAAWSGIDFIAPLGTKLNVICDGDSKTWGQNTPTPWPSQLALGITSNNVNNFGVDGQYMSNMVTYAPTYIDPLISIGAQNVCIVWAGTNDLGNGATAAQLFANLQTYCAARISAGWKVVTAPLTSAPGIDSLVQQFNALLAANPPAGVTVATLPSVVTALGVYKNPTYFSVADGHPTQLTANIILAPAFSMAINAATSSVPSVLFQLPANYLEDLLVLNPLATSFFIGGAIVPRSIVLAQFYAVADLSNNTVEMVGVGGVTHSPTSSISTVQQVM